MQSLFRLHDEHSSDISSALGHRSSTGPGTAALELGKEIICSDNTSKADKDVNDYFSLLHLYSLLYGVNSYTNRSLSGFLLPPEAIPALEKVVFHTPSAGCSCSDAAADLGQ